MTHKATLEFALEELLRVIDDHELMSIANEEGADGYCDCLTDAVSIAQKDLHDSRHPSNAPEGV